MMQVGETHCFKVGGWHMRDLVQGEILMIEGEQVVIRLDGHGGQILVVREGDLATEEEVTSARREDLLRVVKNKIESLPLEALEKIAAIASDGEASA